jgi:hypothetical protein
VLRRCFFVVSLLSVAAVSASAQERGSTRPVFGYLDSATAGLFGASAAPAAAPVVRSGTLIITVNVAYLPAFPATATTTANVTVTTTPPSAADPSYQTSLLGIASIARSGATGVATITLPYALTATTATDTLLVTTTLSTSIGGFASLTQIIPLPANGATTRLAVSQRF